MTSRVKRARAAAAVAAKVLLLLAAAAVPAQPPQKPAPPPDEWKGTNFVTAHGASVTGKGDPFDPSVHAAMTPQGEVCSNELNAAIYRQDVLHAFEAKAHFDNCAFEESARYIESFVAEARGRIARIPAGADGGNVPTEVRAAMLAFGQALHGIQDFYAHTNYVELVQMRSPGMTDETAIPIVELWQPAGREQLRKLVAGGLHSGRVWWSLPRDGCPAGVPTHGALAKDGPGTTAGKAPSIFKHSLTGQPISNHTVAYNLASRATREFLRWAGQTWPQLEKFCGQSLRYIVQPDRRAAD